MKSGILKTSLCAASIGVAVASTNASAAVVSLGATADTYVGSSTALQGTAQGSAVSLVANQGTNTNHRWAYVRFDLSSIDFSTVTNLELDLHTTLNQNITTQIDVYGLVSNEAISESTLTFNNDPNRNTTGSANTFNTGSAYTGLPLATFSSTSVAVGALEVAFNVSSGNVFNFINADSDKIVTFVLNQQTVANANGQSWSSKEATTDTLRPALLVTTPEPSMLGLAGLCSAGLLNRRRRSK